MGGGKPLNSIVYMQYLNPCSEKNVIILILVIF